jgi:glycosyltransferase involved in cell wall biosynthesis
VSGRPAGTRPLVLHVVTRYLRGGSEQRLRDLIAATPDLDHHVAVGIESDTGLLSEDAGAPPVTVVRSLVRQPSPIHDAAALARLTRLIRRCSPDLVVTHQSKAGVLGRIAARRVGRPTLHSLSMANFGPGYPAWQDVLFRHVEVRLSRSTDAYAVVGSDLAERYTSAGVAREKLMVIRSGVRLPTAAHRDPSVRLRTCRGFGLPTDRPLVLSLGSLEPRKSVLDLVPLFLRIRGAAADPRPFLVVAGDGPLAEHLRGDLRDYYPSDASMLGHVADPRPLIAAADVVVLLSRAEGISQVLIQATAAGTPFVAYEVDGVSELIAAGANGTVVPQGDEAAAARAVTRALAEGSATSIPDLSEWSGAEIAERYRRLVTDLIGAAPDMISPHETPRGATRASSLGSTRSPGEAEIA